jgi:membrane protein DedA with SNARE-associated domain
MVGMLAEVVLVLVLSLLVLVVALAVVAALARVVWYVVGRRTHRELRP